MNASLQRAKKMPSLKRLLRGNSRPTRASILAALRAKPVKPSQTAENE